ncbi:MAG: GGDEF domain-containing protein [Noviherbaspirillum sp.]
MSAAFNILLVGAIMCAVLLFVLVSLLRSGIAGIREWIAADALAGSALALYAFGGALPPFIASEVAAGMHAAAGVAVFAGFQRFFHRETPWIALGVGGALVVVAATAFFHYRIDSLPLRVVVTALFQGAVCTGVALTILLSRSTWRSRYPYLFTIALAALVALGYAARGIVYFAAPGEAGSLMQPSPLNLFFIATGSFALPLLTFGAVTMVHDVMMDKAAQAANRDYLTGAWSRRAFFDLAEREMLRAQRNGNALSLLLLDVDNFKRINDTSGQAAGDQVLIDVVLRAETVLRSVDYFARVGGEEFAVLLPETKRSAALLVAERLRTALERQAAITSPPHILASGCPYTVSIGVAMLRGPESYHDLMRRADAALYAAKATGRNRVVCESD